MHLSGYSSITSHSGKLELFYCGDLSEQGACQKWLPMAANSPNPKRIGWNWKMPCLPSTKLTGKNALPAIKDKIFDSLNRDLNRSKWFLIQQLVSIRGSKSSDFQRKSDFISLSCMGRPFFPRCSFWSDRYTTFGHVSIHPILFVDVRGCTLAGIMSAATSLRLCFWLLW